MTAFLVQVALSNLLASAVIAGFAYAVHRRGQYPVLAHLLWVLVLVKLITPPVLSLPMAHIPATSALLGGPAAAGGGTLLEAPFGMGALIDDALVGLLIIWGIGSGIVLGVSVLRIYRFDRLLWRTTRQAPGWIQFMAQDAGGRLGIQSVPLVYITEARLSPMTWWTGGRVRVVLPSGLAQDIQSDQLAWVLGHELAHVKRRDHLVRWLEWLACVAFWWNPVAWWARQNLRLDEEASCDALVIEHLGPRPRSYARALLAVVEHLARPAVQPPAVATGIDGGVSLERRFRLIIASQGARRAPRWMAIGLVAAVVPLLPVGLGYANDVDQAAPRSAAQPSGLMSDSERTILAGTGRAAVQPTGAVTMDPEEDLAMLSARVSTTSGKIAGTNAAKAGQPRQAKARQSRQAREARARKAAVRARQARARRRAERDDGDPVPTVIRFEQVDRTARQ